MMPQQQNNWPFIINVGNSIIGVTILAMPFCFQQCGVVLGSLMLIFSTWLTIKSCQLLVKAGVTSRRRSFSHLAYFTHGATGKLLVELCMIGMQLGTLVAQVVIIGDLGPAIVSKATGFENNSNLRTSLIVCLCLFVGLPLGLLKDLRALSKTSTMCIMFYTFFTCYVVLQSVPNLLHGDWYTKIRFWRMEGFFQCLPIFSFAFGCQTQLFIVYNAMAEPSIKRINGIISSAVLLCFAAYLLVAFFGYIAFCDEKELTGDIINHFSQNTVSDAIKLCFVFSIAVSIPLIVFPCRTSLYTLLFPQGIDDDQIDDKIDELKPKEDVPGSAKIPEQHFQIITASIIVGAMVTGILVPNVEFVLGLTGATMGTLICYIFPALFFIHVMSEASEGRLSSKLVLISGLTILIASTYITLNPPDKVPEVIPLDKDLNVPQVDVAENLEKREDIKNDIGVGVDNERVDLQEKNKPPDTKQGEERHEPPIPQEPLDTGEKEVKSNKEHEEVIKDTLKVKDEEKLDKESKNVGWQDDDKKLDKDKIDKEVDEKKAEEDEIKKKEEDEIKKKEEEAKKIKEEQEEKERKEEEERKRVEAEKKQAEILNKLEQQQQEQQKLIQEQKEILEELKQHKDEHKDAPLDQNAQVQIQPQGQIQNQDPLQPQGQGQQPVNFGQQIQGQAPLQQGQGVQLQQGQGQIPLQQVQGQMLNQQGQVPLQQDQGVVLQQGQGQIPLQQGQGQMNVVPQNQVVNQPIQQQLPNQAMVQNNQGMVQQGGFNQQFVNQNMAAAGMQNNLNVAGQQVVNNALQGQGLNAGLNMAGNQGQGFVQNVAPNMNQNVAVNQGQNIPVNQEQVPVQNVAQNQGQPVGQNVQIQNVQQPIGQQGDTGKVGVVEKEAVDNKDVVQNDGDKHDKKIEIQKEDAPDKKVKAEDDKKADKKVAVNDDLDEMKHRGKRDVDGENEVKEMVNKEVKNMDEKDNGDKKEENNKDEDKGAVIKEDVREEDTEKIKKDTEAKDTKGEENGKENEHGNKRDNEPEKTNNKEEIDKDVKDPKEADANGEGADLKAGDKASEKNGQRDLKMLSNTGKILAMNNNENEPKDYVDEVIENMKNKLVYENSNRVQGLDVLDNSKLRRRL